MRYQPLKKSVKFHKLRYLDWDTLTKIAAPSWNHKVSLSETQCKNAFPKKRFTQKFRLRRTFSSAFLPLTWPPSPACFMSHDAIYYTNFSSNHVITPNSSSHFASREKKILVDVFKHGPRLEGWSEEAKYRSKLTLATMVGQHRKFLDFEGLKVLF